MAEDPNIQDTAAGEPDPDPTPEPKPKSKSKAKASGAEGDGEGIQVPKWRLDEVAQEKKALEARLKEFETAEERRETERAEKTGEYTQVIQKKDKKIESLQRERDEARLELVNYKRYRTWVDAASGVVKAGALRDSFGMIDEDEWSGVDEEDENAVRALAQSLVERKEYLAENSIGAGSGGSSRPLGTRLPRESGNGSGPSVLSSGRTTFNFGPKRSHWKPNG